MAKEIDLDEVLLSENSVSAWQMVCRREARRLRGIKPSEIPDERARENADGSLTIFVPLPDGTEISMIIPVGEWSWRPRRH